MIRPNSLSAWYSGWSFAYELKRLNNCEAVVCRRLENNEDINKSGYIQFNLFNNATNIDVSATLNAVYVLKAVMLGNANKSMLDRYINELNRRHGTEASTSRQI